LGNVTPGACRIASSPTGEAHAVCCEFTYADGTRPHAVLAVLDSAWHGAAAPLVMAEGLPDVLGRLTKNARQIGAEVREVTAEEAAPPLLAGIEALIQHGPPPEMHRDDESFTMSCANASMARSRIAMLLGPDRKVPGHDQMQVLWPQEARAKLAEEFLASPQARELKDAASRTVPKILIGITVDGLGCDPRLVAPLAIDRILGHLLPSQLVAPDRFGEVIPPVVRAWTEWLAEERGLDKGQLRRLRLRMESALRKFPELWNGPHASPTRRYVQDVPDEVACDGNLLIPVIQRREFAVPEPGDRADGMAKSESRKAMRHVSELDAADALDRALITMNDLNARGVPQQRWDSYVAVVEQLWADDPPEVWATGRRMLAAGKSREAILDRLARGRDR
jgi:hypothetical protein